MKKLFSLISIIAVSLPFFVSCTPAPMGGDTVFHPAENNPRTGMTQRNQRYGHGGTHSPGDDRSNRRVNRNVPADPNGIVKPYDPTLNPGGRVDDPNLVTGNNPDGTTLEPGNNNPDPTPSSSSSEAPYAEPVPGKYGLVYSPFVKDKKNALVNVTDENDVPLPPGTEVTDPHTGKIFRVP
jgi:hypothetical protein